jgi:hypothetical protein
MELLESGLEIEVPIGEVDVTASREALEMNPKTIKAIRARLAQIREEIVDLVSEQFKSAKTLVEAKIAYFNFFQKGGSFGNSLETSVGKIKWNGQEITDSKIRLSDKHKVIQYTRKYNGDINQTTFDKIVCSDELNLYYDDTDRNKIGYRRRANTLLNAGTRQVTILQTDDEAALKAETGLEIKDLPKFSTITPTILASTRMGGNGIDMTKRVKHKMKVFKLDWNKLKASERVRGAKSDYWTVAEIEADKQVFVPIERFEPKGSFGYSLRRMRESLYNLHLVGIDIEKVDIYGVKAGKNTGDMIPLEEWAVEQAKALPKLADEVAVIKDFKTNSLFTFVIEAKLLKDGSLAKEYSKQYQAGKKLMGNSSYWTAAPEINARLALADIAKLEIPNAGKLLELSGRFKTEYPLIALLSEYEQEKAKEAIVEYINLLDEARDAKASAAAMAGV